MGQLEEGEIVGRYGAEPRVEALTAFREELYGGVDAAVNAWRADARFIPRFLLSAAVFLPAYFAFSYLIRDPIPVIDDMIYAAGVSFLVYTLLKRKDPTSEPAAKKRAALTAVVDGIRFSESPFVLWVEEILHRHETGGSAVEASPTDADRQEAEQLVRLMEDKLFPSTRTREKRKPRSEGRDRAASKDPALYETYLALRRGTARMSRKT